MCNMPINSNDVFFIFSKAGRGDLLLGVDNQPQGKQQGRIYTYIGRQVGAYCVTIVYQNTTVVDLCDVCSLFGTYEHQAIVMFYCDMTVK